MIATKRDLLPASCGEEKIAHFVFGRLKDLGIRIERLILASKEEKMGVEEIKKCVDELANRCNGKSQFWQEYFNQ